FWSFCEPAHRRYRSGNPYENAIRDYYLYLDREIGELLKTIPEDTLVLVVSDHGARRMEGGIALNQWLMDNSYLALAEKPAGPLPLARARVDWKRTLAWGEGGYCGRVFINVKGREPEGAVEPSAYQQLRNEIKKKLEALPDEQGRRLSNRVLTPEEAYGHWKNIAPDLLVYFGDLSWRAVGSVGHPSWYVSENDTGPDDANHDHEGILIMAGKRARGQIEGRHLMDVAPTVLNFFGIPVPADMEGKIIE
ncbi:MAG: alkaline phosphatase family protein, partial [Bacillota bacterium]